MKEYKALVFDLGNVLIPFDYSPLLQKLDEISPDLGKRFAERYKANYEIHRKFEKSEISSDEFLSIMMDWTEHKINKEDFLFYYSNIFTENEEVTAWLPFLKDKYTLVLLSNTNAIHQKYGWEKFKFLRHFHKLVLSHEVGAAKPEEKIYEAVEEFTQIRPTEHLYIDDIEEYTDAARKRGWDVIVFKNPIQLIETLKEKEVL